MWRCKCSHFCTNVYSLYMWMFFKLVSEKHDFSFFNNYSLSGGWFYMKKRKVWVTWSFREGYFNQTLSIYFQEFVSWFLLQETKQKFWLATKQEANCFKWMNITRPDIIRGKIQILAKRGPDLIFVIKANTISRWQVESKPNSKIDGKKVEGLAYML